MQLFAQDSSKTIGHVSISSPTAASLGKFGDIPVSYHTGIPNIDIPIYTVESGSLKLPIGLSYHASGLKVQENASWVGAGWSLNAGGVITRTVVGSPDDRGNANLNNVLAGYYSDFGFNSYLNTGVNNTGVPDDINFTRGFKDGEPDLYFFNFGNYSGKFYFNDDRTPILVPEADFKIQTYYSLGPGFLGFIITTPDGVKYYFGNKGNNSLPDPIETTIPTTLQNGPANGSAASSSWFLNKIISADGVDSINLKYISENYSYYTLSSFPIQNQDYNPAVADPKHTGTNLVKNFVSGVRLSQITFPNGSINFTQSANPRTDLSAGTLYGNTLQDANNYNSFSLGSISITNNSGFCKKDSFYYGYFLDPNPLPANFFYGFSGYNIHSDAYKLRLDSMQESSCDGSLNTPPYKFNYFNEFVPRRLSFGIDHWGFSNGVTTNSALVPSFHVITLGVDSFFQGANRDGGWPAMRGGGLQKIVYPTGGNTSFDFEPKDIDTFYSASLQAVSLTYFPVHYYGQGGITDSRVITLVGSGALYFTVSNYSTNYSPTLSIVNSGGTNVANTPSLINVSSTYNNQFSLPAGNYTVTLSYPANSGPYIINGAVISVGQWQYVSSPNIQPIGGLRIKTVTTKDGLTSNDIVTSYNYSAGGAHSTGVLYSIPTYVQVLRNDLMKLVWPYISSNGCWTLDGYNAHGYYVSPNSVRPMASLQGENMGYNEVQVSQAGNGRSVHRYYGSNLWSINVTDVCTRVLNQSSLCDVSIPNFPFPPIPFEFMRDELSYEAQFSEANKLLKESYYYPVYVVNPIKTPGHISVDMPGLFSYTEYSLQTSRKTQNKISQTVYDQTNLNGISTTNTEYIGSAYHNLPTRKVTSTSSNTDTLSTNFKYAMDFRVATCDAIPDSLTYYNGAMQTALDTMNKYINICTPQVNNTNNCKQTVFTTYREQIDLARTNFIRYRRKYFAIDTANFQSSCYLTSASNGDTLLKPILRMQGLYKNPVIEKTDWKNTNLLHASFIRYDTSISPLGVAYPGRLKFINLQAPSGTFTTSAVSGATITKDSRYIDETFYTFSKGRVVQVLGKDGIPASYVWDSLNTMPVAKASNAASSDIAYTSFEADGKGNWTFAGTPIADVASLTGSKDYTLNGANNITKSGLITSKTYVVSYWSKSGSASVNGLTSTSLMSRNNWNYFEHNLTATSSITVSGSVTIDELRLFPSDAQMTSYAYTPLVGISTSSSPAGYINFYEYDALARLLRIRDMDKNIVKQYEYKYNIPGTTYFNDMQVGTYTRNNCGGGYVGSAVNDTIPSGTYGSNVSLAAANLQATNDLAANGQTNANLKGTCTASTATITASNIYHASGYSVKYKHTTTLVTTTFAIPTAGGTLGTLPAGVYNIHIGKTGGVNNYIFSVNCNSLTFFGTSADFNNVSVTPTSCNGVTIDLP